MRALVMLAWGLFVVVFDLRFNGVDMLPDPLGWALAVAALRTPAHLHPAYGAALAAGCAGFVVSLPDWIQPVGGVWEALVAILQTLVVLATCTGIAATVPEQAVTARLVRAWTLGLGLALLGVIGLATIEPAAGVLGVVVVLIDLVVFVYFLALLVRSSRFPAPMRLAV